MRFSLSAATLFWILPHLAIAQVAILHIQVVEGEGSVNSAGSRSARPLAVDVTDETGRPVAGAAVSFHLPDDGPTGTFANGLRTDVILTDARGRALVHALQMGRVPGRLQIRIVASKEQAHAGTMTFQYIVDGRSATGAAPPATRAASRGSLKWIVLAAVAGGAAAAGAIVAGRSSAPSSAPATTPATALTVSIGSPYVTVGKP